MEIHPSLVIRGMLVGFIVVIALTTFITANATSPLQKQEQTTMQPSTETERCDVSKAFPQKVRRWCELIEQYSKKHDLSPNLLAALIWQESGGNPTAYSRSGAVGLMQVMPRDGIAKNFQCANGPCFAKRPTIAQLKRPGVQYRIRGAYAGEPGKASRQPARSLEVIRSYGRGLLLCRQSYWHL